MVLCLLARRASDKTAITMQHHHYTTKSGGTSPACSRAAYKNSYRWQHNRSAVDNCDVTCACITTAASVVSHGPSTPLFDSDEFLLGSEQYRTYLSQQREEMCRRCIRSPPNRTLTAGHVTGDVTGCAVTSSAICSATTAPSERSASETAARIEVITCSTGARAVSSRF